jgi:AcrR family transcriptional regulator
MAEDSRSDPGESPRAPSRPEAATTVAVPAKAAPTKRSRGQREGSLSRQDWIEAAREVLIKEGIERVKIEPLAERLKVSRGSFYWHFVDHQALLDALLMLWEETALEPMRAVSTEPDLTAAQRYEKFMRVWVQGEPYCPIFDLSIRRWAMVSAEVSSVVRRVDDARIGLLTDIFSDMGHAADEAFIRARITYFHQIGYYASDVREDAETREKYWPLYVKILAGP